MTNKIVPEIWEQDIKPRTHAYQFAISAMCQAFPQIHNVPPELGDRRPLEVVLTLNGVQVPFAKTVNEWAERYEKSLDRRALERMSELLKGSALQDVMDKMRQLEWIIDEEIQKLVKQYNVTL